MNRFKVVLALLAVLAVLVAPAYFVEPEEAVASVLRVAGTGVPAAGT